LYTVSNGVDNTDDAETTGKILKVNNLDYPNVMMKVFTGTTTYSYLPYRCSNINLADEDIYTWTQNQPGNNNQTTSAKTLSLLNNQVTEQIHEAGVNSTICAAGTGEACESDIIAVGTAQFNKTG
jgi:hypothetical protein